MKKIGFKNFMRFIELEPLELGAITLMVGKNNSGKSTLIKAILLVLDYLKNQQSDTFSFANQTLNDVNIVTFERAKCKLQNEPTIDFYFEIDHYQIEISIWGDDKWTYADVNKLVIRDTNVSLEMVIDYQVQNVRISRQAHETSEKVDVAHSKKELLEQIAEQKKGLEGLNKTSREALKIISSINNLTNKLNKLNELNTQVIEEHSTDVAYSQQYDIKDFAVGTTEGTVLEEIVSDFIERNHDLRVFYNGKRETSNNLSDEENAQIEQINNIHRDKKTIKKSISDLVKLINTKIVFYLGANTSKQTALFNLKDKDNALGQAIHQFYQLKIEKGEKEHLFVEKWMQAFGIGNTFEIKFVSGEAYECSVVTDNVKTHLSDMGMGSLQLMLLFFKIASILRLYKSKTTGINLIIEEPEISLHPLLQSKLADFFYEVNEEYGIKFIVETHSDNIIRRTQVLGLKKGLLTNKENSSNPFKVYYFHITEGPYEMGYTEEGKFNRNFGEGFYDVASKSTMEILKINRQKK